MSGLNKNPDSVGSGRDFAFWCMNRIKEVLKERQLKVKWLCRQINTSKEKRISYGTLCKYVSNKTQPDIRTLQLIAEILGVQVEELKIKEYG